MLSVRAETGGGLAHVGGRMGLSSPSGKYHDRVQIMSSWTTVPPGRPRSRAGRETVGTFLLGAGQAGALVGRIWGWVRLS